MADAAHNDYQSAIMAPTEVLARQHYETFQKLCEEFGLKIPVVLLTGSMTARQKRMAYEALQLYPNAMVVGTHALIQERAIYDNLALVITDEQHRFGVRQREIFAEKGRHPHILVMSATPIPRTLAIILYGDLDISVVDEVPAKRLPVKNCVVNTGYRNKAYAFIENEVKNGHRIRDLSSGGGSRGYGDGECHGLRQEAPADFPGGDPARTAARADETGAEEQSHGGIYEK